VACVQARRRSSGVRPSDQRRSVWSTSRAASTSSGSRCATACSTSSAVGMRTVLMARSLPARADGIPLRSQRCSFCRATLRAPTRRLSACSLQRTRTGYETVANSGGADDAADVGGAPGTSSRAMKASSAGAGCSQRRPRRLAGRSRIVRSSSGDRRPRRLGGRRHGGDRSSRRSSGHPLPAAARPVSPPSARGRSRSRLPGQRRSSRVRRRCDRRLHHRRARPRRGRARQQLAARRPGAPHPGDRTQPGSPWRSP